jgi:HEAT repeats
MENLHGFVKSIRLVVALACAGLLIGPARPGWTAEAVRSAARDANAKEPGVSNSDLIGIIDFYGLRKVTREQVRKELGLNEGDPVPRSASVVSQVRERLKKIPGVVDARLAMVCCDAEGKTILFVGIEEKGTPHLDFRPPPTMTASLPHEMVETYHRFEEALGEAVRKGDAGDDRSQGHSLMTNPAARALQQQFLSFAASNLETLRLVLRNSANAEQRQIAAYIIGYAPKKRDVVDDLTYAVTDADEGVRNNATRALGAIAALAARAPEQGIRIEPTPFIAMLSSVTWTDRNKALFVLEYLTEKRSATVLDPLRRRAVPSLVEMARWKSPGHAYPAYLLLGRIAGLNEQEMTQAWDRGERETMIARALAQITDPH